MQLSVEHSWHELASGKKDRAISEYSTLFSIDKHNINNIHLLNTQTTYDLNAIKILMYFSVFYFCLHNIEDYPFKHWKICLDILNITPRKILHERDKSLPSHWTHWDGMLSRRGGETYNFYTELYIIY